MTVIERYWKIISGAILTLFAGTMWGFRMQNRIKNLEDAFIRLEERDDKREQQLKNKVSKDDCGSIRKDCGKNVGNRFIASTRELDSLRQAIDSLTISIASVDEKQNNHYEKIMSTLIDIRKNGKE